MRRLLERLKESARRIGLLPAPGEPGPVRRLLRRIPILLRVLLVAMLVPIVEYALLVWISEQIGFTLTLLFVLGTGVLGAWMVRKQGLEAWGRILDCVRRGESFGDAVFDAALILIAGILLIAPGVLTDTAGFLLLIGRFRGWLKLRLSAWLRARAMIQIASLRSGTIIDVVARTPENQPPPRASAGSPPSEGGAGGVASEPLGEPTPTPPALSSNATPH